MNLVSEYELHICFMYMLHMNLVSEYELHICFMYMLHMNLVSEYELHICFMYMLHMNLISEYELHLWLRNPECMALHELESIKKSFVTSITLLYIGNNYFLFLF